MGHKNAGKLVLIKSINYRHWTNQLFRLDIFLGMYTSYIYIICTSIYLLKYNKIFIDIHPNYKLLHIILLKINRS